MVRFHLTGELMYVPYVRSLFIFYAVVYSSIVYVLLYYAGMNGARTREPRTTSPRSIDHASRRSARSIARYVGATCSINIGSTRFARYRSYTPVATLTAYAPYKNANTVIALTRNPAIGCASNHRSILFE